MTIKDMLKSGKTQEDILKEIADATREIEKERKEAEEKAVADKKRKEQLADAKEAVICDIIDYLEILTGEYMTEDDVDDFFTTFDKEFTKLENLYKVYKKNGGYAFYSKFHF